MAKTHSPWIHEGPLAVRFEEQQGHLVKRTVQPDHGAVLRQNETERKQGKQRFLEGYKIGSVPINDLPDLALLYPELFGNTDADRETKKKALVRFTNDPAMAKYIIAKA